MKTRRLWEILVLFTFFVLAQCDQFILYDELRNGAPQSLGAQLAIAPAAATLTAHSSLTFSATGGVPPFFFSVVSGSGTIDASTGMYTAPPGAGTDSVRVTDSAGQTNDAVITVTAAGALAISPPSVSLVTNGTITFTATGGTAPYAYSVESGGGAIDAVTGVYTAPPTSGSATVRVTDSQGTPETADATISVTAIGALAISPSSIVLGTGGSVAFGAFGGVAPYTFSVVSGGGAVVAATGAYTAPAVADSVTVRVTDSDLPASSAEATIAVYEPLRIVPEGTTMSVGSSFGFSAMGGKTPYTFAVASGGGTIDAASGVYSAPGAAGSAVVRVTDDLGNTRNAAVTITAAQPLVITPASTTLLVGGSHIFAAVGGISPYTFSILGPADGSINAVTGEYSAPGAPATDTIRVTDAANNTSDASVSVVGAGPLSITPASVTVPVNGQRVFSASGGAPPYSYAIIFSGAGSINASTGLYHAPATTSSLTVQVTDSLLNTANAAVTVAGSGCGLTFTESEPNDDTSPPWTDVNDFGILLVPGCTVTILGVTDVSGESDVFAFNRGSANSVTFIATWNSGDDELDFQLYDNGGNGVIDSDSDGADVEFMIWTVGGGSPMRYLELEVQGGGGVSYTLTISAD